MGNRHYGEIGDVWKHLALCEILAIEQPFHFWESHAGSADYSLTLSPAREYGIMHFWQHAFSLPVTAKSSYYKLLSKWFQSREPIYPGSPLLAMSILQSSKASFLFCDLDLESLCSIKRRANNISINHTRLSMINQDGIDTIWNMIHQENVDPANTLIFIDPYDPIQPSLNGVTSLDLFCECINKRYKVIMWFGFDSNSYHQDWLVLVKQALSSVKSLNSTSAVWSAEVQPEAISTGYNDSSGSFIGSGLLYCHLSEKSDFIIKKYGKALARLYHGVLLPNHQSGSLCWNS